ncbi:HET-domain-containing protein [Tothia fuscella]|uniref:HET-domain-containing protein n=1 Tax=Tothia fuscella TaxID=1048955 RepID=A0A9P4NSC1_9PEZI|nr:HET-domain-containing protein [Tothia fuscella]
MRLINTTTLELEEISDARRPMYAILSHTWGNAEVSYQDLLRRHEDSSIGFKSGFEKITFTCFQARKDNLKYAWIDTCCIDKSSSAELTEAINSMYTWYRDARVCYAYLADVNIDSSELQDLAESDMLLDLAELPLHARVFLSSKWMTRGWTLQELLAPNHVRFYSYAWQYMSEKSLLTRLLSKGTKIDKHVLEKSYVVEWNDSIAKRMPWAANRKTTRVEDLAYCQLGIFGVSMPLLYGEGENAFIRLQEEIIRTSSDQTIFVWERSNSVVTGSRLLAPSPAKFRAGGRVLRWYDERLGSGEPFAMTNLGLEIRLPLIDITPTDKRGTSRSYTALLACRYTDDFRGPIGLHLIQKTPGGAFEVAQTKQHSVVDLPTASIVPHSCRIYITRYIPRRLRQPQLDSSVECWI